MIQKLDDYAWRVEQDDWFAIVVKTPRVHALCPYIAFIYPQEGYMNVPESTRVSNIDQVAEILSEYKRLWDIDTTL